MRESNKLFIVVVFWLSIGFLFLLVPRFDYFLFWELSFGIGGTIAVKQQEDKEEKLRGDNKE